MLSIHGYGYKGKWYQTLNQAFNKMLGEIEYDFTKIPDQVHAELVAYIRRSVDNTTSRFTPYSGGKRTTNNLQVRSGRAKSELKSRQTVQRVGANKYNFHLLGSVKGPGYLNLQEDGGTITAKSGYLTIPLPDALDSKGLPLKRSPRDWKNTFTKRSKKGNIVIFGRKGRKIVPLYVLTKSVHVPARLGLAKRFSASAPYFERKVLDKIDNILRR